MAVWLLFLLLSALKLKIQSPVDQQVYKMLRHRVCTATIVTILSRGAPVNFGAIQGDKGKILSFYRHQQNMLRLWNHLITMNDDRLTKLVFLWDLEKSNNQNWSHHDDVKRLLQFLDMST